MLLLVVVVSIAFMATVIEPAGASWRGAFAIFIIVSVAATAAFGAIAMSVQRERSWAVVIPALLCSALLVNEVLQRQDVRHSTRTILVTESDRIDAVSFYESLGYESGPYRGFKKRLPSG